MSTSPGAEATRICRSSRAFFLRNRGASEFVCMSTAGTVERAAQTLTALEKMGAYAMMTWNPGEPAVFRVYLNSEAN